MDVGKDGSHLKLHQPPETHPQQLYAPGKDRPSEWGYGEIARSSLFQLFGHWSDERGDRWVASTGRWTWLTELHLDAKNLTV